MTVRWGIIGCGAVCEVKSGPPLYQCKGSELVVVMRRNRDRAEDYARRHGVQRFTNDAREVIEDPRVDAVYVATPPGDHLQYALATAAAGKPCYVEKPMARNASECRTMLEAFETRSLPLFVAYYRRALPRFTWIRQLIERGELGGVRTITHRYQRKAPQGQPATGVGAGWRQTVELSGGGLFLDLGSHAVDLIDYLCGPLQDVHGHARRRAPSAGDGAPEDTVSATFSTESGALGALVYSFHTAQVLDELEIVGDRGRLVCSLFGSEPLQWHTDRGVERVPRPHPEHVQEPLIQSMVDELSGRGPGCPSTGQSALRASAAMDRMLGDYYGGRDDAFWARRESWPLGR